MTAIIIVFNTDRFLTEQIRLLQKHVTDKIAVIDNSTDFTVAQKLKLICDENLVDYTKTAVNEADSSKSHAFACTIAIEMYRNTDDSLLLLDHDIFPLNKWQHPADDIILAGIPQIRTAAKEFIKDGVRPEYTYLWPGLLYIDTAALEGYEIDVKPCVVPVTEVFLDTGGGLYKMVKGNPDRIQFYSEHHQTIKDEDSYSLVDEGRWMHFRNGSNWKKEDGHEERINNLMSILYANS